jgi:predicted DNA-binding transcriptional regulator YafY
MPRLTLSESENDLIFHLLEKPRTQKEIAEYFGVNRKTVKRAIDKISLTRFLVEEKIGRNVYYSFDETSVKIPEFTPTELATLILAQQAIAAIGEIAVGSPFAKSAESLLAKVRKKIPPLLRENLANLAQIYGTATTPNKNYSQFSEIIKKLEKAALEQRTVLMNYQSFRKRQKEERKFNPYNIYFDPDGATLKVIGFDHNRRDIIPFSIDHISEIKMTAEKFSRPPEFELAKFLEENCFNGIHGKPVNIKLRVFGVTAQIFAERKFHPSQKVTEQTAESLTVTMRVAGGRGLNRFILSWMPDIEVLEPSALREEISQILKETLNR